MLYPSAMTRDYARNKARPKAGPKSQVPGWVWLFTGSVLGAFTMFLVYLTGITPQPSRLEATLNEAVTSVKAGDRAGDETPRPRFDFYQLLKESEVVVQAEPPAESRSSAPAATGPQPEGNIEYVLQVGSFKRAEDADRLRAQLILLNLDARVERAKLRNAEVWHRVLVGPFPNQASVTRARAALANHEIESLLLKRNAEG